MKTRNGLLLLPLAALAACADTVSVQVQAICVPPDDAEKCVFSNKCDLQLIGSNTVDISVADSLELFLQVGNQLPNNENLGDYRLNSNDAWIQEYVIEFDVALPDAVGPVLGSSWVPASNTSVISVLGINQDVKAALDPWIAAPNPTTGAAGGILDLVGHLRLRGVYGDSTEFETAPFDVGMRVCKGCVSVPTCPTAGDIPVFCPPNPGQSPASFACVTP